MKFLWRIPAFALLFAAVLRAHDPGLSTTQVALGLNTIEATVGYAPGDLRTLLPEADRKSALFWSAADFSAAQAALRELGPKLMEIRGERGPLPWTGVTTTLASANSVLFHLTAARPPAGPITLHSLVMDRLPPGHRDYVSVTDERGILLVEKLVGANDPPVTFHLPAVADENTATASADSAPPNFWEFLKLGIAHIWTGYDHLLFLFGLLVVCRSFRSIVAIISCFTIAHSITLALATLNIVNIPSRIIEPAIAASICFVGVENLLRRGAEPKGRWALTFGFGLIHGFGFASVLRELGVGSNGHGLALPLFTFNLGVEIGQISIAAIVLPIVWQLRKNPTFIRRGVPILSAVVAAAGLYWFLERTIFA
jgi:hydrogenase/urease accessory protein HupE